MDFNLELTAENARLVVFGCSVALDLDVPAANARLAVLGCKTLPGMTAGVAPVNPTVALGGRRMLFNTPAVGDSPITALAGRTVFVSFGAAGENATDAAAECRVAFRLGVTEETLNAVAMGRNVARVEVVDPEKAMVAVAGCNTAPGVSVGVTAANAIVPDAGWIVLFSFGDSAENVADAAAGCSIRLLVREGVTGARTIVATEGRSVLLEVELAAVNAKEAAAGWRAVPSRGVSGENDTLAEAG